MNAKEMLRSKGMLLGLGVVLGAAVLGGGGYALYQHIWGDNPLSSILPSAGTKLQGSAGTPTATPGQSVSVTSTPTPTPTPTPTVITQGNVKIFKGYGVQVSVSATDTNGNAMPMSIQGNKVIIEYFDNIPLYIQILTKSPADSLQTAITKQFMSGYSATDCTVQVYSQSPDRDYAYAYERGFIIPSGDPAKCPPDYVKFDDNRFFLMDVNHPDKYVFVDAGQGTFDEQINGKSWPQSILFY